MKRNMPKAKQQSLDSFFNPPKRRMTASRYRSLCFIFTQRVCPGVWASVCHTLVLYKHMGKVIFTKFGARVDLWPRNNLLDFGRIQSKEADPQNFFYYFCPDYIATSYTLHLHSADDATRLRYLSVLSVGVGNAADNKVSISVFIKLPINYLDLFNN